MPFSKKTFFLFFLLIFLCISIGWIEALEVDYPRIDSYSPSYTERQGLPDYVVYIIQLLTGIALVITVISLVKGGLLWMTSTGEPLKVKSSKEQLSSAVMGFLIILSSFVFLSAIDPTLLDLDELEVVEVEESHPPGIYLSLEEDIPEEIEEESENIYRITTSTRNLREISGQVRSIRIANQVGQEGSLMGYYYGVVLHEEQAFRGRCEYFVNSETGPLDISVSGSVTSVTVIRIDEIPSETGGVTAYERPDFREDYPYQMLERFTDNFRNLEISEVWSLDIEGNYGVILASGDSWETTQEGCGVFLDSNPMPDLKGHHMNRCNPRRETPYYAAHESCATHYAVFPLFR